MLKKTGHIFIILLFLFGTTGLTITRHYCDKNLIHTSIYSSPDNCCKGNCPGCHNEKISFRITDQFESHQTQIDFTAGFKTLLEQHSLPTLLAFSNASNVALLNDALGDHYIKPSQAPPMCAGHSTSFLQVFLF
jgi:hypothetical protein